VPSPEQEQERSILAPAGRVSSAEKQRLAAQDAAMLSIMAKHIQGEWWREELWKSSAAKFAADVGQSAGTVAAADCRAEVELKTPNPRSEAAAPKNCPVGLGKLTSEILEREVADWNRSRPGARWAVTQGCAPGRDSSSDRRFQGSINKHGNRRRRPVLVECLWRLSVFQLITAFVKKWRPELLNPRTSRPRRKKIIVAMARSFAVDWLARAHRPLQSGSPGLKLQVPSPSAKVKKARPQLITSIERRNDLAADHLEA